ncbi:MAG: hypothetical protein AAFN77_06995 [Planctomycetota bacterium]
MKLLSTQTFAISLIIAFLGCSQIVNGQSDQGWEGTWITDRGILTIDSADGDVTGSLDKDSLTGTVSGKTLEYTIKKQRGSESGTIKLVSDSIEFSGTYDEGYRSGKWMGWKQRFKDGGFDDAKDFSGVWLTSLGTMMLEQSDENEIKGSIGPEGWSSVDGGTIEGEKMTFEWTIRNFNGAGWFEMSKDGKRIYGVMNSTNGPSAWIGLRPDGYSRNVVPKAGEIVKGVASNGMLYNLRMPDGWKEGDEVDCIVLLHGSNWTTSGMVFVTAKNWPELGKKFAILGIQGQNWAKWSKADDLRFNYTYVNWVGRSTLGGFPYTHRESPFLVGKLLDEFNKEYSLKRIFVGGHSQGGYLTYVLHMHMPEKIAGTFPMAGGMIIQAEPDVFDDEDLKKAQRDTPMYILHGRNDNVVSPSMGEYAHRRLFSHDFDRVVLDSPRAGHAYDFLPIDQAVNWLDMLTTDDQDALLEFAQKYVKVKKWKNVGLAIERAMAIDGGKPFAEIWQAYEDAAKKEGPSLLRRIQSNKNGKWVDGYLKWHDQFAMSTKQKATVVAFQELRSQQDEAGEEAYKAARAAFRSGDREQGYAKYQEIVDQHYASRRYTVAKAALGSRK